MVHWFGKPLGAFCDVGCCGFSHWRFLSFRATFSCHQHSTLASQAREGFHQFWALYPDYFRLLYFCQIFPSHFYRERYGFERTLFTHSRFLLCTPSPQFWEILWLRSEQEHPIKDPTLSLPSQSWPFPLTHGLELFILLLQDHSFINCASKPRSIKLNLNYWICFACSKSCGNPIKTLWTRLDKKYCLKLLREKYWIKYSSKLF